MSTSTTNAGPERENTELHSHRTTGRSDKKRKTTVLESRTREVRLQKPEVRSKQTGIHQKRKRQEMRNQSTKFVAQTRTMKWLLKAETGIRTGISDAAQLYMWEYKKGEQNKTETKTNKQLSLIVYQNDWKCPPWATIKGRLTTTRRSPTVFGSNEDGFTQGLWNSCALSVKTQPPSLKSDKREKATSITGGLHT